MCFKMIVFIFLFKYFIKVLFRYRRLNESFFGPGFTIFAARITFNFVNYLQTACCFYNQDTQYRYWQQLEIYLILSWNFYKVCGGQELRRNRVIVPARHRQATQAGGIHSLESIPGHHKHLKYGLRYSSGQVLTILCWSKQCSVF